VNGEAIHATRERPGDLWHEGEHVRFTRSKDGTVVYAIALEWPGETLRLASVRPAPGATVTLLGSSAPLAWTAEGDGVSIRLPPALADAARRPGSIAWAFRIPVAP
jgi:alpha-L-fucosidase